MSDAGDGLRQKFAVTRMDGADQPGGRRAGAEYFVMDYRHDPNAWIAVASYAVCGYEILPLLSRDLARRLLATLPVLILDKKAEAFITEQFGRPVDQTEVYRTLHAMAARPDTLPTPTVNGVWPDAAQAQEGPPQATQPEDATRKGDARQGARSADGPAVHQAEGGSSAGGAAPGGVPTRQAGRPFPARDGGPPPG